MSVPDQGSIRNRLLSLLTPEDYALVREDLVASELPRGMLLSRPDESIEQVWFPEAGIGSIIAISPEGQRVEAGLFGRDGFAPAAVVLGADHFPLEVVYQVAGSGHSLSSGALLRATERSAGMRTILTRYAHVLSVQIAYTALSNAVHPIDERCARWLLMTHDPNDGDEISLTHEFLSLMLAVRRPSVTSALHVLEGNRFIISERGCVIIRNRAALEEFAGDAYGKPEREYARLIGGGGDYVLSPGRGYGAFRL